MSCFYGKISPLLFSRILMKRGNTCLDLLFADCTSERANMRILGQERTILKFVHTQIYLFLPMCFASLYSLVIVILCYRCGSDCCVGSLAAAQPNEISPSTETNINSRHNQNYCLACRFLSSINILAVFYRDVWIKLGFILPEL